MVKRKVSQTDGKLQMFLKIHERCEVSPGKCGRYQPVEKGVWNFANHTEPSVISTFGEFQTPFSTGCYLVGPASTAEIRPACCVNRSAAT